MGGCISQAPTVQHADNDNAIELTRVSHLKRNPASEQNTNEQQHHIEYLTTKIQQLEVRETHGEERLEHVEELMTRAEGRITRGEKQIARGEKELKELKKIIVDFKAESEIDKRELAALRTDYKDLRSELETKSRSTNINIQHVDTVHASDTATHAKTLNSYTSSEMLIDNSQTVNSTEEHISVNENTETRTDSTDQIPKPRPDWKL